MTSKGKDVKLKVNMHCKGCADTVRNCLRGFDGVEEIITNMEKHEVIVKGENVDIVKVLERLRKKYNKNAELISPELPKIKKEEEKKKEIPVKTVALKIFMHCEGCVRDIKKIIYQMEGVLSVKPDMARGTVAIKGAVDPPRLVEHIKKRTGKHAEIVKEEAKKDMEGKEKKKGEAKEEAKNGKKGEEKKKGEASEDCVHLIYRVHCPSQCPQCHMNRLYCCCCCENAFSDENVHSCSVM
ncbi:heavy metal-associated isoprenylated plant protein 8-like [Rhodamnia argentea]|uniref:Heavy metal-associated isoprenylated plant protein 8-like n=1 Tax=Rhodamnia argentea TaxID=178133 RepID=A0A8B8NXW6_9MYRT|nr:heavy metal-associated isoprenylated plant protein 8-like [Rhodamnia argentea]